MTDKPYARLPAKSAVAVGRLPGTDTYLFIVNYKYIDFNLILDNSFYNLSI